MPRLFHAKMFSVVWVSFLVVAKSFILCNNVLPACSSVSFTAAPSFNLPPNPRAIAIADFNGDGRPDVVVPSDSANKITVMLGNGTGGFATTSSFSTGARPVSVAVGDFNNDSKIDIVTANYISSNISLFIGDGTGGFAAATNLTTASSPQVVVVGDFNLDGNHDLAIAHFNGTLEVMLGSGSASFGAPANFALGDRPVGLALGDFNLDGKPDLALVRQFDDKVSILLGNGLGGFGPVVGYTAGTETSAVITADFNNDGKLDLAAPIYASKLAVLLNNGDGSFGSPVVFNVAGNATSSVVAGDFNNDGNTDLAVGHTTGASVRFGNGAGGFGPEGIYSVGLGPSYLATDDFNADGTSDLIVVGYSASSMTLLLNSGTGNFVAAARYSTGSFSNSVLKGDFNNDGKLDLAAANSNTNDISILLGTGTGSFGTARRFSVGPPPVSNITHGPMSLASGDFNADGKTDLVTANYTGNGISILLGDGSGDFPSATKISVGGFYPWFVAVGDFNTDGKLDLAITRDAYYNNISILFGDGTGNFGAPVDFAGVHGPRPVAVADLNGDGKPDLAVGNRIGVNSISVFLGNGVGGFSAPTEFSLGGFNGPRSIAIGDFNSDGKADLVVANESSNDVALLTGNGVGSFSGPVNFSVGTAPTGVTLGDFDGDGLPDVAVANSGSHNISILSGNGLGGFSSTIHYDANSSGSVVAGDFNGDGLLDVASDGVRVLINNCVATPATPLPSITINDPSVSEESESGTLSFTVGLSAPSTDTVTVQYFSSSQSAVSGSDFQPVSGTLTFTPGEITKPVVVPIINDAVNEFAESFRLNLHHPVNATIMKRQGIARILDADPEPAVSINSVSVSEQGSGISTAVFTVALSVPSGKLITLNYSTADGTATAGTDYFAASGPITFGAGSTTKTIAITVNGDTLIEPNETFSVNLSNPINVSIATGQGTGTIINFVGIQFSAATYSVGEGNSRVDITVSRVGGTTGEASVDFRTVDDPAEVRCDVINGISYARCDYATTVETLNFAVGETTKIVTIPIIDDGFAEGNETFSIALSNVNGASPGTPATAIVTINDNETVNGSNPIFTTPFFVRQHYLDFLSREPEAGEPWSAILNGCSDVNNNPACDRLTVSAAFFGSPEFQLKGYFVYRFYKLAFNRLPAYAEIVGDMRAVTGQTPGEVFQKKAAFTNAFAQRTEFTNNYGGLTDGPYASALMGRYSLTQITTPDPAAPDGTNKVTLTTADLTNQLTGGTLTRAQVLRAIADSDQVLNAEFNQAFVAMQYYGYLRRTPEAAGYNSWLNYLNAHPTDSRTMVNGFMNSVEYRLRFGPQ